MSPMRTPRQERNRRYYESMKASEKRLNKTDQDVSDVIKTLSDGVAPDKEKVAPKEINPKENPPKGGQKKNPRAILEAVLSPSSSAAVLDHRHRKRSPLTVRAAELLAAKIGAAPQTCGLQPDQAADLMIEKGWTSFEPAWALNAIASAPTPRSADISPPKERWHDYDDEKWRKLLAHVRNTGEWLVSAWGPPPGQSGCKVPSQLLTDDDLKRHWRAPEARAA